MGVEPTRERWRPQQDLKSRPPHGDDDLPLLKLWLLASNLGRQFQRHFEIGIKMTALFNNFLR